MPQSKIRKDRVCTKLGILIRAFLLASKGNNKSVYYLLVFRRHQMGWCNFDCLNFRVKFIVWIFIQVFYAINVLWENIALNYKIRRISVLTDFVYNIIIKQAASFLLKMLLWLIFSGKSAAAKTSFCGFFLGFLLSNVLCIQSLFFFINSRRFILLLYNLMSWGF